MVNVSDQIILVSLQPLFKLGEDRGAVTGGLVMSAPMASSFVGRGHRGTPSDIARQIQVVLTTMVGLNVSGLVQKVLHNVLEVSPTVITVVIG